MNGARTSQKVGEVRLSKSVRTLCAFSESPFPMNLSGRAALKPPALQTLRAGRVCQQLAPAFGVRASLAPLSGEGEQEFQLNRFDSATNCILRPLALKEVFYAGIFHGAR